MRMNMNLFKVFIAFILLLILCNSAWPADVTLMWDPVETAKGYKSYCRPASAPEGRDAPAVDAGSETFVTIHDPSGPYYFSATAYNDYGESEHCPEVFANLLSFPLIIKITEVYANGISRETTISP